MKINWKGLFGASLLIAISNSSVAEDMVKQQLTLESCHIKGIRQQVQCGTYVAPENYAKPDGTKIDINFVVLPAIDNSTEKLPLMFLAGGPGQAAAELSAQIYRGFNEIRKTRDLILIDQRGTGKSHPLQCEDALDMDPYTSLPEDFSLADIEQCIAQLKGDLSQYNSENAIRDFDAVRGALGHQQVHIYGGSYGTRAGLVYMRMFPTSLKSVVLDSVGPIEVPIGLFGKSVEHSFIKLIENCQNEESCATQYPELAKEFTAITHKLSQAPVTVEIAHPRLGTKTAFTISKDKFISSIQMQLYSMETRSLVPLLIHQAYLGNYMPLAGIIAQSEGGMGIYIGLHFNIVCNEDFPKISDDMKAVDADNNFAKGMSLVMVGKACAAWPTYQPSADFYQTVTADIPTLIMSGELDPVTPASNGEKSHVNLPNSHHIISKNNAHIVASTTCGIKIVNEFLEKQTPKELDESCLEEIPDESFMVGLNGGGAPQVSPNAMPTQAKE
ncbi:alpha/beta fold hydrolase [Colwellia sp. MB3u-70]|uniref:alpha/beta fold hydrolase n=1 Tax=unclassified Colwellia TaxID=196834 RepID=UPI0015F6CE71|nr:MULTISPECIES: alpha/beta fold hydrolase [unclassified Colwellia]MBA6291960.1 alpha/beta fold hydrolase [Colwellia sp. MB3u-8]MBA6308604.1 alpha/beta fold hydrolase [Colwellia sp. MB3u-70]